MVEASLASQKRTKGRCWMRPGDDVTVEFIRSGFRAAPQVFVEEFVQIGIRNDAGETIELAFLCDLLSRLDERMHGNTRQRSADTDPAHAEFGEIVHRKSERPGVQKIDRLRRDGLHCCSNLLAGLDAG